MAEHDYTLVQPKPYSYEIKKSRFLAQAAVVSSAKAALDFIRRVSEPLASHNCWAYRLKQDFRFSDDGEPSSSAGQPILTAIDGQNLIYTAVVVSRWFGGTKLGVGGLIRAYGRTAAQCLKLSQTQVFVPTTQVAITCGYSQLAIIKDRLSKLGASTQDDAFGAHGVCFSATIPDAHLEHLRTLVTDLTHGQGQIEVI